MARMLVTEEFVAQIAETIVTGGGDASIIAVQKRTVMT
jgi:hypothetical protein